jgi:hypothetical protein
VSTAQEAPDAEPYIRVSMMLADAAQVAEGKLSVLGGGWSQTGPFPTLFAIAMDVKVPWNMANAKHQFRLELVDSSGRTVSVSAPNGDEREMVVYKELEVGRPPGVLPGSALDAPMAIAFPSGLPLEPGARYEWRLMIDGKADVNWSLPFVVRPNPQQQAA